MSTKNGVDVEQLGQAVEAITAESAAGQFRFRAETEWTDGLQCVTAIDDFNQAGEQIHTQGFTIEGDERVSEVRREERLTRADKR